MVAEPSLRSRNRWEREAAARQLMDTGSGIEKTMAIRELHALADPSPDFLLMDREELDALPAGERWANSGLVDLPLASGAEVRGTIPSALTLARMGELPAHLVDAAIRGGDPAWRLDPEHPERPGLVHEYVNTLISMFVRAVRVDGAWHRVELTPDAVARLDPFDAVVLEDVVLGFRTPAEVRAAIEGLATLREAAEALGERASTNVEVEPPADAQDAALASTNVEGDQP